MSCDRRDMSCAWLPNPPPKRHRSLHREGRIRESEWRFFPQTPKPSALRGTTRRGNPVLADDNPPPHSVARRAKHSGRKAPTNQSPYPLGSGLRRRIEQARRPNNSPPPVRGGWPKAGRRIEQARRPNTKGVERAQTSNAPLRAAPLSLALPPQGEGIIAWGEGIKTRRSINCDRTQSTRKSIPPTPWGAD
jgi:hypothetical protein